MIEMRQHYFKVPKEKITCSYSIFISLLFPDPSTKDDAANDDTRVKEIAELEGLIPEIREKIADTKDMQNETLKKIGDRRLIEDAFNGSSASKDQNGSATADKSKNGMSK